MSNFYEVQATAAGSFNGRTMIQATGETGGWKSVFVKFAGIKNALRFPPIGGILKNPFKGRAKIFAGDLIEFVTPDAEKDSSTVKILKSYEVAAAVTESAKTVYIVRDGFRHIPFVGDNIMVAPDTLDATGTAVTVTAVEATTNEGKEVWKLSLSADLGAITKGKVLVEAAEAGAGKKAMVTNPNAFAPCDYDFLFDPALTENSNDARYMMTPCLAGPDCLLIMSKMSPIPPAVKAANTSKWEGWFSL